MRFIAGNAQHRGARGEQQDHFAFSDPADLKFLDHGGLLAVLADGAGGMEHGRAASSLAVKAFLNAYLLKRPEEAVSVALDRSLTEANVAVRGLIGEHHTQGNVATTLIAAVLQQDHLHWISVGDSALYRYRDGVLSLLTTSHVYARELERDVALGRISLATALNHPDRDALTSYLGKQKLNEIDRCPEPCSLAPGDRILLASDGLFKTLTAEEMCAQLCGRDPQEACESLVTTVLQRGRKYQDNVTVLCIGVDEEPEARALPCAEPPPPSGPKRFCAWIMRLLGMFTAPSSPLRRGSKSGGAA